MFVQHLKCLDSIFLLSVQSPSNHPFSLLRSGAIKLRRINAAVTARHSSTLSRSHTPVIFSAEMWLNRAENAHKACTQCHEGGIKDSSVRADVCATHRVLFPGDNDREGHHRRSLANGKKYFPPRWV